MKPAIKTPHERAIDATAFAGMLGGVTLLMGSFVVPDLSGMTLPAFLVLVPSILFAAR